MTKIDWTRDRAVRLGQAHRDRRVAVPSVRVVEITCSACGYSEPDFAVAQTPSCFPSMPVLPQTGSDRGGQQQAVHRAEGSPEGQEEEAVADRPLAGFNFASVIPTYST
jgi:hypothetical protein